MPTPFDLLYIALFALALPTWDTLVSWPKLRLQLEEDPDGARTRLFRGALFQPWLLVALGAVSWMLQDRSWTEFGFTVPEGWRLWVSIAIVASVAAYHGWGIASVARSAETRANLREQAANYSAVLPHSRRDLVLFSGVSVTAGFTEEFLFRGYCIVALAPWLGWWGAAALSTLCFAVGHAYQGAGGILRTGIVGALYVILVALSGSLWPAIALHAVIDLGAGVMSWLALREAPGR